MTIRPALARTTPGGFCRQDTRKRDSPARPIGDAYSARLLSQLTIAGSRWSKKSGVPVSRVAIWQWRLAHLPAYQQSRPWLIPAADLVMDTGTEPAEVAQQIADALPQR